MSKALRLEEACTFFLNNYKEALPRVGVRALQPVLDALTELVRATPVEGSTKIQVHAYPRPTPVEDGLVVDALALIFFDVNEKTFHWKLVVPVATPEGIKLAGLPGDRTVTIEDLIELDVTLTQLAESIKTLAARVQAAQVTEMTWGQPVGKA
jgi:hypothetical protein